MKILHFIACIMLPISIINNGYTMEIDDADGNANQQENQENQEEQNNQAEHNFLRRQIVKFYNGINMCSLASLNQCLSVLNPGNNQILHDFITGYNNSLNSPDNNRIYHHPSNIFETTLEQYGNGNNIKKAYKYERNKNRLLYTQNLDITSRYRSLLRLSKLCENNINNVNSYMILPENEHSNLNKTLTEISKQGKDILKNDPSISNETRNLILHCENMRAFVGFSDDICNETVTINGNTFDLVSVAFLEVDENNNSRSHYVSAKKLPNGRWILIDSLNPDFYFKEEKGYKPVKILNKEDSYWGLYDREQPIEEYELGHNGQNTRNPQHIFNNFRELVERRVNNAILPYNNGTDENKRKLLPRLLFYKKRINNNTKNNSNNINISNNNHIYNPVKYSPSYIPIKGNNNTLTLTNNGSSTNFSNDSHNSIFNSIELKDYNPSKYKPVKTDSSVFNSSKKYKKDYFGNNKNKIIDNCDDSYGCTTPKFSNFKKSKKDTINSSENFSIFDSNNFIDDIDDITTKVSKININIRIIYQILRNF